MLTHSPPNTLPCLVLSNGFFYPPVVLAFLERVGLARQVFPGALLIFLATILAYSPVYQAGYIWDDTVMLTENSFVKSPDGLLGIWSGKTVDFIPVTLTMLWCEWRIFGLDSAGYHVINVFLHAFGAILLWRVLVHLKIPGAGFAAILFALHPVGVASVAWVSERKNTLSLVFYLLSLLLYLRSENGSPAKQPSAFRIPHSAFYWFSLIAFILALLSKSSVVILPVVLLLCLWWMRADSVQSLSHSPAHLHFRDLLRTAPFFAGSLVIGLVTIWFQQHRAIGDTPFAPDPLLVRVLSGTWAVWLYLWNSIAPIQLSMIYPRWMIDPASWISYLPAIAWLALLVALWFMGSPRFSAHASARAVSCSLFFALAYFWVTLWPVLGVFDMYFLVYSQTADHWQYLSLPGICALFGAGAAWIGAKSCQWNNSFCRVLTFSPAVCILLFSLLTWQRARIFTSSESLWRDTVEKNPAAWVAHNNLGNALEEQGRSSEAKRHHTEALRLGPNSPDTHYNMAKHLARLGQADQAENHYRTALKLAPAYVKAHNNLGILLEAKGETDAAFSHYSEAVRLSPNYAVAQNNFSQALLKKGKVTEALAHGLTALRLNPAFPEAHYNVANAFSLLKKSPDAARHFLEALRLRPDYPEAHFNLGNLLAAQGKFDEARRHFADAVRLRPNFADAQNNLGNVLAVEGKWSEAAEHYAAALRSDPAHPVAQSSLGYALFQQNRIPEAEAQFLEALKKNPRLPDVHYHLGNLYSRLGKNDSAKIHYGDALNLRPDLAEAHFQLALIFLGENKSADAAKHFRAAVTLRPNWGEPLNNLAWILATSGQHDLRNGTEALEFARRASLISGSNAGTLDTLAAAQAQMRQFTDAVATATAAIDLAEKAGQKKLADEIRSRLQLYQSAQPFHETTPQSN